MSKEKDSGLESALEPGTPTTTHSDDTAKAAAHSTAQAEPEKADVGGLVQALTAHQAIADHPIILPPNAYVEALRQFGRDEMYALVINVGGTAALEYALAPGVVLPHTREALLAVVGPVIEKFGFFAGNMNDARKIYNETPEKQRKPRAHYLKEGLRRGARSLALDVAFHDPTYITGMWLGQQVMPGTPAWLISIASFGIGVLVGAAADVGYDALRYRRLKKGLKKVGFDEERYLESRFLVRADQDPQTIVERLASEFDLGDLKIRGYADRYFANDIPELGGRTAKLRLRRREDPGSDGGWMQSAQVIFTRATQEARENPDQFSYFPVEKDKVYLDLRGGEMPQTPSEVSPLKARAKLIGFQDGETSWGIHFTRTYAQHPDRMLVATDKVHCVERPYNVVELKVYRGKENARRLCEAMRMVMLDYPLMQTTHGKLDIIQKVNGNTDCHE